MWCQNCATMQSSSKQPTERLNIMSQENDLIHVAIYTHEYGTSVRTFTNIENAYHWKNEIGAEYWSTVSDDPQPDFGDIGDAYFEQCREKDVVETFEIVESCVENL